MAIAAASSLPLEGVCCSTSYGMTNSWLRPSFDVGRVPDPVGLRCKNPFLGSTQFHWLSMGHDLCLSKVSVAADYPDSVPDSSSYMSNQAYHPLEEVKDSRRIRETKLTSAEIARSTVEANSCAWLVFPGTVHCEPHEQISWGEFQYVIDDYGDIFFEIFDDTNILEDRGASNPVNALFGMEIPIYENRRNTGEYNISEIGNSNETLFEDDYFEVVGSEVSDVSVDWGMPDASTLVHPIYFSKCLTKAANMEYNKTMDYPSNGVSIVGCLRPAYADEESYIRTLFHCVDSDGYNSDWKDGEILSLSSESDQGNTGPTLYRLEIMRIELFSVYGVQSEISLQDFQDAEPDVLVHSTPAIVERFSEKGISCNVALKALCKKKGLDIENCKGSQIVTALSLHLRVMDSGKGRSKPPIVDPLKLKPKKTSLTRWMGLGSFLVFQELSTAHRENQPTQELYTIMRIINSKFTPGRGAHLIGVDSLGMDVRVFSGVEVQTHRFPFKVRATSEAAAEKQIQQLLFPRARRKKLRTLGVGVRGADPF